MGRILATLERIEEQQTVMNAKLQEITEGSRQLPQCRDNERRIEDLEKKISQHSYNELNHRVKALEASWNEQKDDVRWLKRAVIGSVITVLAFAVRSFLT